MEKEILKETVSVGKTDLEKKPKKRYYKPKKKKEEDTLSHEVANVEKPFVADRGFKLRNTVGKYCIGEKNGFCIHLESKPKWLHRKLMNMFLGWTWTDNEK